MKMRGRKIAYWVCAALLVIPVGGLINYATSLELTQPGALSGQIAAVGVSLFIGAYAALYKLLPTFGRGGRWRVGWSRAATGVLLVALGLIVRWYFLMGRPPVTEAANALIALGGYLLIASVEKPPVPEEARPDDTSTIRWGSIMKVKWVKAAYFFAGILLPIPLNLLVEYLNDLHSMTIDPAITLALVILVHAVYLILGAYIGLYNLVDSTGVAGRLRVRWPKFALGAGLLTLGLLLRLSYYGAPFASFLHAIISFNDRFFIWFVLSGFLMANAFERVPLKEEAAADGPHPDEKADGELPEA